MNVKKQLRTIEHKLYYRAVAIPAKALGFFKCSAYTQHENWMLNYSSNCICFQRSFTVSSFYLLFSFSNSFLFSCLLVFFSKDFGFCVLFFSIPCLWHLYTKSFPFFSILSHFMIVQSVYSQHKSSKPRKNRDIFNGGGGIIIVPTVKKCRWTL